MPVRGSRVVIEQSTKSAIEDIISSLGLQVGAPFVVTRDEPVKWFVECSSTTAWSYRGLSGQGINVQLFKVALESAGWPSQIIAVDPHMANLGVPLGRTPVTQSAWARALKHVGYTEHVYDPESNYIISRRPSP